jgi:hypothetical protein
MHWMTTSEFLMTWKWRSSISRNKRFSICMFTLYSGETQYLYRRSDAFDFRSVGLQSWLDRFLLLLFIEDISSTWSYVQDVRTAIPVFLKHHTLIAVVCVRDTMVSTDHTFLSILTKRTLFTNSSFGTWSNERITTWTSSVAVVAHSRNMSSWLLEAHYQIILMTRHSEYVESREWKVRWP